MPFRFWPQELFAILSKKCLVLLDKLSYNFSQQTTTEPLTEVAKRGWNSPRRSATGTQARRSEDQPEEMEMNEIISKGHGEGTNSANPHVQAAEAAYAAKYAEIAALGYSDECAKCEAVAAYADALDESMGI
jgi:hypothetical protein